jgi:hypothetical protein
MDLDMCTKHKILWYKLYISKAYFVYVNIIRLTWAQVHTN